MTKDQFYKAHVTCLAIYVVLAVAGLIVAAWSPLPGMIAASVPIILAIRSIRNYERDWAKQESQNRYDHGCKFGPYETPNE